MENKLDFSKEFTDRRALVTGGSRGIGATKDIGLQTAKDLATHGFTVPAGSRSLERGSGSTGTTVFPSRRDEYETS